MRQNRESIAASKASIAKSQAGLAKLRAARQSKYLARRERTGLVIGMTSDEASSLDAWGYPDDVNVTETAKVRREQWAYQVDVDNEYERIYLYFSNGVLTTIQD